MNTLNLEPEGDPVNVAKINANEITNVNNHINTLNLEPEGDPVNYPITLTYPNGRTIKLKKVQNIAYRKLLYTINTLCYLMV